MARDGLVAAATLAASVAVSFFLNTNYGPLGFLLGWALLVAAAGTPANFIVGLSSRWTGARQAGLWYAALALLLATVVHFTAWKGGYDLLMVGCLGGVLGWFANWLGTLLSPRR